MNLDNNKLPEGLTCESEPENVRITSGGVLHDELTRWKFLVNIYKNKDPEAVQCGGTIVNGCSVITSAACCWDYEGHGRKIFHDSLI
jgi:hypothetical protein